MHKRILFIAGLLFCTISWAKTTANVFLTVKPDQSIGTVSFEDTPYGLLITPNLESLPVGIHGFHVHEHPSCDHQGKDAGGHFTINKKATHLGPYNKNAHLGDMPALYVDATGKATLPVLAPRLKERYLKGHAIIIHAGGDNYSDEPQPLGGGGPRIACGLITKAP